MNSNESPGRKKPISSPVSAKMIERGERQPALVEPLLDVEQGQHVGEVAIRLSVGLTIERRLAVGEDDRRRSARPAQPRRWRSGRRRCPARLMIAGRISSETRFITLISGFSAGPAVSLNGSPTVSPMTAALWASVPLPPWWPSSMYFLALSHAPPALRQVVGHQLADEDDRGEERAEGEEVDAEADDHRREHGEQRRGGQLAQRGRGADVDDRAVVGLLLARHDLAVGELACGPPARRRRRCGRRRGWRGRENRNGTAPPISRPMKTFGSATLIGSRSNTPRTPSSRRRR